MLSLRRWLLCFQYERLNARVIADSGGSGYTFHRFNFQFMAPLSSFYVGYKSESNDANDSKKEDLSQLFGI